MVELIEIYYRQTSVAEAKQFNRGQLCEAPGYYLPREFQAISLERYDPRNEDNNLYKIMRNPPTLFDHPPVYELRLSSKEELIIIKCKLRPFIIVSHEIIEWLYPGGEPREECYVGVPLYSFHDDHIPEFRNRVRCLEYPTLIYLPSDERLGVREGFARLDRVQVIPKAWLTPRTIALTEDAFFFLSEWLRFYITGEIDELFSQYRRELMASL